MIGCDSAPGYTVCRDRRSCDLRRLARLRAAREPVRRGAGLPGGGAGAAGHAQRASLAADLLRAAGAPAPIPAEAAGLPQTAQGRRAAAGRGDRSAGPAAASVVRPEMADRCYSGAVRHLPGDRQAQRPGRMGQLRALPGAFALVLRPEAVPAHDPQRDAGGVMPGQPEDRQARGGRGPARAYCPDENHLCPLRTRL